MELIKKNNYKIMKWKNGLGDTAEILIEPESAVFSNNDFLWRVSSARIQGSNKFSTFLGYDRILVVCQGSGLYLNKIMLNPLIPYKFSGETLIECELVECQINSDSVIDFGIIYKPEIVSAEMTIKYFFPGEKLQVLSFEQGTNILFCVSGQFSVNQIVVEPMDTLLFKDLSNPLNFNLSPLNQVVCVHLKIREVIF
jgi:hypothetical protein